MSAWEHSASPPPAPAPRSYYAKGMGRTRTTALADSGGAGCLRAEPQSPEYRGIRWTKLIFTGDRRGRHTQALQPSLLDNFFKYFFLQLPIGLLDEYVQFVTYRLENF